MTQYNFRAVTCFSCGETYNGNDLNQSSQHLNHRWTEQEEDKVKEELKEALKNTEQEFPGVKTPVGDVFTGKVPVDDKATMINLDGTWIPVAAPEELIEVGKNAEFLKETQRLADKYNPKTDWDGSAMPRRRMTSGPHLNRYWVVRLVDVPKVVTKLRSGAEYIEIIDVRPDDGMALIIFRGQDEAAEAGLSSMTIWTDLIS